MTHCFSMFDLTSCGRCLNNYSSMFCFSFSHNRSPILNSKIRIVGENYAVSECNQYSREPNLIGIARIKQENIGRFAQNNKLRVHGNGFSSRGETNDFNSERNLLCMRSERSNFLAFLTGGSQ